MTFEEMIEDVLDHIRKETTGEGNYCGVAKNGDVFLLFMSPAGADHLVQHLGDLTTQCRFVHQLKEMLQRRLKGGERYGKKGKEN